MEGIGPKEGPDWSKVTNFGCGRTESQAACLLSCIRRVTRLLSYISICRKSKDHEGLGLIWEGMPRWL